MSHTLQHHKVVGTSIKKLCQKFNPAQGQFGEQDIDRILMNIQRFAGGESPDAKGTL